MRQWRLIVVALLAVGVCAVGLRLPVAQASPRVETVTAAQLKTKIGEHKGRVVVINFWATWCAGCVEEFPNLVKLQHDYAGKGVDVIFVSADDLDDLNSKVVPFVKDHKVEGASYIMKNNMAAFIAGFDPELKTAFALPRTYIYDRKGNRSKVIGTASSYAGFSEAIKPLL